MYLTELQTRICLWNRGEWFKLKERRFRLGIKRKFYIQRAVRLWNSCPEHCECPIPGGAQGQAGWGPGQPELAGAVLPIAEAWDWMGFKVLSNPKHPVTQLPPLPSFPRYSGAI